jgi:hypothetical protein
VTVIRGPEAGQRLMDTNVKLNYAVFRMLGGKDAPAERPVRDFSSAMGYAAFIYGKAPYFYLALRRRLGSAGFDRALRAAVGRNRFRIVDLWGWLASIERAVDASNRAGIRPLATVVLRIEGRCRSPRR